MKPNQYIFFQLIFILPCLTTLYAVSPAQAAPAAIVDGDGGLDLSIEADNYKNVFFSFTCRENRESFANGSLVLHFSDDTKFSPPIQNLITEAQRLKDDHTINMSLCLNEKCQKVKWGKDDLSGGYYTKIRLDYGKPITSIKVIPENIPSGIYSKTSITKQHLDQICPQVLGSSAVESVPSVSANPQFELEFWSSVKNSNDLADFQAYLDKYPQGQFQALARRRIDRLKESMIPSPPVPAGAMEDVTPVTKPKLIALVAGVSDYENDSLDLLFPAKDAKDFGAALKRQMGGIYREVLVRILENPTSDELLNGLDWLRREVTSPDIAVLFISGHGASDPDGDYYYLTRDSDPERLRRTAVASFDIKKTFSVIPSKVLAFVDTAYSAQRAGSQQASTEIPIASKPSTSSPPKPQESTAIELGANKASPTINITRVINDLTAAENGVVVFASSTGKQYSLENPALGNGAFAKALVEGFDGAATYMNDGVITINALDLYLSNRVRALTDNKQTPTTTKPQSITDFPIAVQR